MEAPPGLVPVARSLACEVRIYTGDVAKRLGTYRAESDLIDAAVAKAAQRGETVTDLIVERLQAYIRDDWTGQAPFAAPVTVPPVYTPVEAPPAYVEPPEELEAPPCKHPAERVEAGECGICHADVW